MKTETRAPVNPETVPSLVRARIYIAHDLQQTRRQIASTLGGWYVAEERRGLCGSQEKRDRAAAGAREWRAVAIEHGHNPAAVRRAILDTLSQQ